MDGTGFLAPFFSIGTKANFLNEFFPYYRMSRNKSHDETDKQTRIAIVSDDKCKPKRCRQECKKSCPVVRMGKLCIEVSPNSKIASLSEELCIGCGICVKVSIILGGLITFIALPGSMLLRLSLQRLPIHHQESI